jgi:FkbM family methyltransferase
MTFISHAQNFEDVMLWRALKDVQQGFYIDVGAWSPDIDSVTRAFYEAGWAGINIEPHPQFYSELVSRRPNDINLDLAVSDVKGQAEMHLVESTGLSSLDLSIATEHRNAGLRVEVRKVQVQTIADIWRAHVPQRQPVHFLKVDVEGTEDAVLRGNDWEKFRPWIVLIEAMQPMEQVPVHQPSEAILVDNGYIFAYADGLNRFYIAKEQSALLDSFQYPPNVFDEFNIAAAHEADSMRHAAEQRATTAEEKTSAAEEKTSAAEERASAAEEKASASEEKASAAEEKASAAEEKASAAEEKASAAEEKTSAAEAFADSAEFARKQAEAQLLAIQHSASWRLTYPMRLLVNIVIIWPTNAGRRVANRLLAGLINAFETPLASLMKFCLKYPRITALADKSLSRLPFLHSHLKQILLRSDANHGATEIATTSEEESHIHLSPRARQIHADLKAAIKSNR